VWHTQFLSFRSLLFILPLPHSLSFRTFVSCTPCMTFLT
jgi:hypothetical protein